MTDPASTLSPRPAQASDPAPDDTDRDVDSFADHWLDLRESIDHRARALAAVEGQLPARPRWRALDLGGGTGSNLRYLMPRLGGEQHWWLVDHDPRLLAGAGDRLVRWALDQGYRCEVDGQRVSATGEPSAAASDGSTTNTVTTATRASPSVTKIATTGDTTVATAVDTTGAATSATTGATSRATRPRRRWTRLDIIGPDWRATVEPRRIDLERLDFLDALSADDDAIDLVTASALLDLVSIGWLSTLVDWCAARRVAMLFALSYDGRVEWMPSRPEDAAITAALERDQRRDKGMGLALGSGAVARLRSRLAARGLTHAAAESDWLLESSGAGAAVQRRLIDDWSALAARGGEEGAADAMRWKAGRLALLDAGTARLRVGHVDVAAWPATDIGAQAGTPVVR